MTSMRECDRLKAVEKAASLYLFRLLINRVAKRLIVPSFAALVVLIAIALTSGTLSYIGGAIFVGLTIWAGYDAVRTTNRVIERFFQPGGMWQAFKNLPKHVLRVLPFDTRRIGDCLNERPACCTLFQREVERVLVLRVNALLPGWKKGGFGFTAWGEIRRDIVNQIAEPLSACCENQLEETDEDE